VTRNSKIEYHQTGRHSITKQVDYVVPPKR
jgi:hypothetical protein